MKKFGLFALPKTMTIIWLMGLAPFLSLGRVDAQSLRDPTLPPTDGGSAHSSLGGASLGVVPSAMTVIVRNGHPYLVVATRLYAQGQKLGQARIERITETEIWFREGGVLRKVPQFAGIQRRTVSPVAEQPVCKSNTSKTSSSVAPCAGVQP